MGEDRARGALERVELLRVRMLEERRGERIDAPVLPDRMRVRRAEEVAEELLVVVGEAGEVDRALDEVAEQLVRVRPRADDPEAADEVGAGDGKLLRDRAAHREAHHVRADDAELVAERDGVGGHVGHGELPVGQR